MEAGAICQRLVFTIRRSERVSRAAQLMRENHVGYLVVVELEPFARPLGVLTDHDIAAEVVAREMDPRTVCASDIMTANPITASESDPLEATFQKMLALGLRRLPVVNDRRELVGILVMDDLFKVIVNDAQQVLNAIRSERQGESVRRAA
jgi:CBS domain-containing protein